LTNFGFDSRNRLTQAGDTVYNYDAENQRIGVNQIQYVVNSQPALSQVLVKEDNGQKTFYVYGLGLIGQESNGEYLSYHFDFRGSTVALTSDTAQIVERFQYSPYGMLLGGDASITPFLFNGMYGVMTDGNGLYYMRARFYSPEIRRFVNQDILLGGITDGQTLNRYAYVTGRPVSYVDPFGLKGESKDQPIEMGKLYDLFYEMAALDLAFDHPQAGCEARTHIMIKKMLELGYNPLKVWFFNNDKKLSVKGREKDGLKGWWVHVAPMLYVNEKTVGLNNEVINSKVDRWVIEPALFPEGPISLEDFKAAMNGIEHSSQSKPGEPPKIRKHGMLLPFAGSYTPDIPDSDFPYYFFGFKFRGTMDEVAATTIRCAKKDFPLFCK